MTVVKFKRFTVQGASREEMLEWLQSNCVKGEWAMNHFPGQQKSMVAIMDDDMAVQFKLIFNAENF